jgi:hypothetical protein
MDMDLTPEAALDTLRTADPHALYFYSQHIAVVICDLVDEVKTLRSLMDSLDHVDIALLDSALCEMTLTATMSKNVLKDLLGVIANANLD